MLDLRNRRRGSKMNDDTEASPAPDDPTMGAQQEAWSQAEDHGVDEAAHFSWERVGLIVAAGGVVVLLAFLVITALKPDKATPRPSQTSAPVAASSPSVVPAPKPPVAAPPPSVVPAPTPTVTVTATPTPARPTTTQAASPAELDQQFLNEVTGLWGGKPHKPDAVIGDGHRACELLAQNPNRSAVTRKLLAEETAAGTAGNGALDPGDGVGADQRCRGSRLRRVLPAVDFRAT
jgi:hypothetical protein